MNQLKLNWCLIFYLLTIDELRYILHLTFLTILLIYVVLFGWKSDYLLLGILHSRSQRDLGRSIEIG